MGRILFVCNTIYQILTAVNIKQSMRPEETADIIVSDVVVNGKHICEMIEKAGVVETAYYVQCKKYVPAIEYPSSNVIRRKIVNFKVQRNPEKLIQQYVELNNEYDELFFSNTGGFINDLYRMLKHKNFELKTYCFEDGTSSYTTIWRDWFAEEKEVYGKGKWYRKYLGIHYLIDELSGYMVYHPELMDWQPDCGVTKIPLIDRQNNKIMDAINRTFEYEKCVDTYKEKVIYFEDCFAADGEAIHDEEVIDKLIECVGKEEIFVKRHPRSQNNTYLEYGLKTNRNMGIPWEVIALNMDNVEEKILISHVSGSIAMPYLIAGIQTKSVSLIGFNSLLNNSTYNVIQEWLLRKVYKSYSELFLLPQNVQELEKILSGEV